MNNFQQLLEEEEKRMSKEASDRILHAICTNAEPFLRFGSATVIEPAPETNQTEQSIENLPE